MSRFLQFTLIFGALITGAFAMHPRPASAGVFTLLSDPGYYNSGSPVSAIATITTADNGTVTIDLANTEDPTVNMGQVLTGFTFKLSNGATTGTYVSSSADVVKVGDYGIVTDLGTHPVFGNVTIDNTNYAGWTLGAGPYLSVFGTGGPNFGGLDVENQYSANGSIAGNSPHNPFSRGTIEFVMNVAGVTSATSVTDGTFQFGTNQNGGYVISVPDSIAPEPSSLVCTTLLGLSAIGLARIKRKARLFAR